MKVCFFFYKFGVLRAYTNNYPIKSFRQVFGQIEWLLENFKFSSKNSMSKLRLKISIFSKLDRLSWKLVYRVNFGRWWRKTTFEVRNQLVTWSKTPKTAKSWIFSSDNSFWKILVNSRTFMNSLIPRISPKNNLNHFFESDLT